MIEEALFEIDGLTTVVELKAFMSRLAGVFGFSAFNFIDIGDHRDTLPFYVTNVVEPFEKAYKDNKFYNLDPYISKARRSNTPFTWNSIGHAHAARPGPRSGAARLMELAHDFGLHEGFIVPFHFRDPLGRAGAALMVYLWTEDPAAMRRMLRTRRHELHVITLYWAQKAIEVIATNYRGRTFPLHRISAVPGGLSDREREVLQWAAAGKTTNETAAILGITDNTVEVHYRNILGKLDAVNRTHAVALAIREGLIDI